MIAPDVQLRRQPYPYRAMLAICSDLDETPHRHTYWEIVRFLNTTEATAMGPGVGLEVGNSIYFGMSPEQFAYQTTDEAGRAMIRALIRSGHIDCLHSYGDRVGTREQAGRLLDELARHDCRLEVWVDHGIAPSNFGQDIMHGHGDQRGHRAYHADLTVRHGIRYVWRGRVTSVTGQGTRPRLGGLLTAGYPLASGVTLGKEMAKQFLARCGSRKYAMHGPNSILQPATLRDGQQVYEFLRCNPHWGGVSSCDTAKGIAEVLTHGMLSRLAGREGVCILYTHLGKVADPRVPFNPSAVEAFRRLAYWQQAGNIMVTTTRRLLGFCRALLEVRFTAQREGQGVRIDLSTAGTGSTGQPLPERDLAGLTFYVPDPRHARVLLDGREMPGLRRNGPDHTGAPSVSLPWPALELPRW